MLFLGKRNLKRGYQENEVLFHAYLRLIYRTVYFVIMLIYYFIQFLTYCKNSSGA